MKRYSTILLFCTLTLVSGLVRADIIDDAIGNIQQAINDAYHPDDSRADDRDDDDGYNDGRGAERRQRQYEDRLRSLDDRQRQLDSERRQLESDRRRLDEDY